MLSGRDGATGIGIIEAYDLDQAADSKLAGALQDPVMELRDVNGELVRENDDWEDTQRAAIAATAIAPNYPLESAILVELPAGHYTAVVRGNDGVGVGIVEVYNLR